MGKYKNMDKVVHFTMEIPQVKNKVEKTEKPIEVDSIFDKSGGKKVQMAKKSKKKNMNKLQMSFYNFKSKKYKVDNK